MKKSFSPFNVIFESGPQHIAPQTCCEVSVDDNILKIQPIEVQGKNKGQACGNAISLSLHQIVAVSVNNQPQSFETNKSVFGRAAVGGILAGRTGATIGGMSGLQKNKIIVIHYYVNICFTPKDGGTSQLLVLKVFRQREAQCLSDAIKPKIASQTVDL